ncbi:MAG: hypothetical protein EAX81_07260 [Candidatus Thorarchaeota archaeon]|nr:hypothetical protein [Candidatus Thorarchaeota archaeon]
MPNSKPDANKVPLEKKKEQARKRTRAIRENAIFSRKKRQSILTPGVKIMGGSLFDNDVDTPKERQELEEAVASYVLRRGGFEITEESSTDTLSKRRDSKDVMNVMIARIAGFDERWGLDRKFLRESIHAHRFEDKSIVEYTLESYGGYVSRTYYVVDGLIFRAFAQHNFRKDQ